MASEVSSFSCFLESEGPGLVSAGTIKNKTMLRSIGRLLNVPKGFGKFYPKGMGGGSGDKGSRAGRAAGQNGKGTSGTIWRYEKPK